MKILGIDIETAPNKGYFWGLFNQNISIKHLIDTSRTMCFAAQWYHTKARTEFWSEHTSTHAVMVRAAWELLNEADVVVHYYGSGFDIPTLNKEFVKLGLGPPAPYEQIDLYRVCKSQFKFASHKLDHILQELDLGSKVAHPGFQMWVDCMDGDEKAWRIMEKYNRADVSEMKKLYEYLIPWIKKHPNYALYSDTTRPTCTNCASVLVEKRGFTYTKTQKYQRYVCKDCGTWLRGRSTLIDSEKRSHILVQA